MRNCVSNTHAATAISLNAGAAYIYSLRALEAYNTLNPAPQN